MESGGHQKIQSFLEVEEHGKREIGYVQFLGFLWALKLPSGKSSLGRRCLKVTSVKAGSDGDWFEVPFLETRNFHR